MVRDDRAHRQHDSEALMNAIFMALPFKMITQDVNYRKSSGNPS